MIDFPNNPTVGQQFNAAGVTWVWDGVKWTASGLGSAYLPLAGGTLTGDLIINGDTNTLTLNGPSNNWAGLLMKSPAGQGNWIGAYVGGKERWEIDLGNGVAESGGNAGSNLQIARFNDAGTFIDDPLVIRRSDGQVTINALSAPQAMGDNRIINGDMRIDQRNNGASGTAGGYTVDRWQFGPTQAGKGTWGRNLNTVGGPAGFPWYLGFQSSSAYTPLATDQFAFWQAIEADMVSDFAWGTANAQPVTLSFWARSSLTGTFSGAFQNYAGTRSYPFSFSLPTANTWTKITLTVPGDTAGTWVMSGVVGSLYVGFDVGNGSTYRGPANAWASAIYNGVTGARSIVATNNATFYVTGVKLEIGSVATPFNRQSLAKSLADCQRYYQAYNALQISCNASGAGGQTTQCIMWPPMRAGPTAVVANQGFGNANQTSFGVINASVAQTYLTALAAGPAYSTFAVTLNAEL